MGFSISKTIGFMPPTRKESRIWWKVTLAALFLAAVVVAVDFSIGLYQKRILEERAARQAQLEKMAAFHLRADLADVSYTPDGKYKVRLWMENLFPEHDMYLMIPTVNGYIQIGSLWQEVPTFEATRDPALRHGRVILLKERVYVDWVLDIQTRNYFELLEGYMHVRIDNDMFISPEPEPKESIAERLDNYYIHLKPFGADDRRLRALHNFPGEVPIFIPMPPH